MINVLILGKGAREHALAKAYLNSGLVNEVQVLPGNGGMRDEGILVLGNNDPIKAAAYYHPDLIDVANDDDLAAGLTDQLRKKGHLVFGPSQKAARLEWDKDWSRQFMDQYNLPRPDYKTFKANDPESILYANRLLEHTETVYFKANGLHAGKGVIEATNVDEIENAFKRVSSIDTTFLVEEGLEGEEFSAYAATDGARFIMLGYAQDNKRLLDGDKGPNTGGMGVHTRPNIIKGNQGEIVSIMSQTVDGMRAEGTPFAGIIYLGGIVVPEQGIKIIEYNARWGDPEAQALLPGLKGDYYQLARSVARGMLKQAVIPDDLYRVCVVGAAKAYPQGNSKGKRITKPDYLGSYVTFLSAGIEEKDGELTANGGRLYNIVGEGETLEEAHRRAYDGMGKITVEDDDEQYRTDIARRDL